ncbi:MAG: sodium/solute symporter [Bacteriovoracaceae bacterium]|nr:sodium/solute symporter [Bacteriovoracaceae bacterium]
MNDTVVRATGLDFAVIIVYFLGILGFGAWFSRYTKSTKDFFFGGQRFSWWLIAMSCVATVVGSYSFMKYSAAGFKYGLASSMTYLNDWLILPFFIVGWFPIIYFMRVTSIPEYFEKRFDVRTRIVSLVLILVYMIGYVGINFYTLGVALQPLLGVNFYVIVIGIAIISAIYMHAGGQTSVIMTDLVQGFVLLAAGFTLLYLGVKYVGGLDKLVDALPFLHRFPLAQFNTPPKFNFVGIFWQDALASSVAFYFMNQGVMMRFMSVKSPRDGYKAMFFVVIVLMPLASLAIANSGWLGRGMVGLGLLPEGIDPNQIFIRVASLVAMPGVFGLILAALTAALMSTIDTLITAISALFVNDIWRPFVVKNREDKYYLKVARITAIAAAVIGVLLVPIYAQEKSIYIAHGKFIATITPAMIVVILLSVFWKRFTPTAAFVTLVCGSVLVGISAFVPDIIKPFSHGIDSTGGFKFMRAFFGIIMSVGIGVIVSFFTKPKADAELVGLTIDTFHDAKRFYKGGEPNDEVYGKKLRLKVGIKEIDGIELSSDALSKMKTRVGDIIYVADARWYFGGLRSVHTRLVGVHQDGHDTIYMNKETFEDGHFRMDKNILAEKII